MMPEKGLTIVDKAALEVSVTKKKKSLHSCDFLFLWAHGLRCCKHVGS